MAIRYSGDVEIRMNLSRSKRGNVYEVSVRWPRGRAHGEVPLKRALHGPEAFDKLALAALRTVLKKYPKLPVEHEHGTLSIRRVFQAPCPIA